MPHDHRRPGLPGRGPGSYQPARSTSGPPSSCPPAAPPGPPGRRSRPPGWRWTPAAPHPRPAVRVEEALTPRGGDGALASRQGQAHGDQDDRARDPARVPGPGAGGGRPVEGRGRPRPSTAPDPGRGGEGGWPSTSPCAGNRSRRWSPGAPRLGALAAGDHDHQQGEHQGGGDQGDAGELVGPDRRCRRSRRPRAAGSGSSRRPVGRDRGRRWGSGARDSRWGWPRHRVRRAGPAAAAGRGPRWAGRGRRGPSPARRGVRRQGRVGVGGARSSGPPWIGSGGSGGGGLPTWLVSSSLTSGAWGEAWTAVAGRIAAARASPRAASRARRGPRNGWCGSRAGRGVAPGPGRGRWWAGRSWRPPCATSCRG